MNFIIIREKLLTFEFSNLVIYKEYGSCQQMQNFSTISPKFYQLGKKKTGTWVVTTAVM